MPSYFKLKKLYGPFLWMGFNCLKATATSRRQFTFYHSVPKYFWYSFYRPQNDERLSWPWSHPVVLNTGSLDWESSALTTRPLLHTRVYANHKINLTWRKINNWRKNWKIKLKSIKNNSIYWWGLENLSRSRPIGKTLHSCFMYIFFNIKNVSPITCAFSYTW